MLPRHNHMEESIASESEKKRRLDLDSSTSYDSDDRRKSREGLHSDDHYHAFSKKTTTEARAQGDTDSSSIGTNSQWLFSRNDDPQIVLRDNLGDTSAMVESLTSDVKNWSLTNLSSASSNGKKNENAHKQKCQQARREVMRSMLKKNSKINQE